MRLAVVTLGSAGDLHPYLAVAREMRRRGHEVHFFSQEPHRAAVEAEGLHFGPIASRRDHERTLQHPGIWHPVRGFGVLWRHLCVPAIGPTLDVLAALADERPQEGLTVFASPLAVGARLLREARGSASGLRLLTAYTAPSALRSCEEPMFLGAWKVPAWLPGCARGALWRALDLWKLEPMAKKALAPQRARLSLAAEQSGSTFGRWIHSPDGGIALFPTWFAPPQPDWPTQPAFAGFPVYEPGQAAHLLDERLQQFLDAGAPPVVVNAGSAAFAGEEFLGLALRACRAHSRRCVLLNAYVDMDWLGGAEDALLMAAAPLCSLLPRAAAIIHHGGIGTCAQALAARIPQVVLPTAYDQFDNGWRIAQGGWGCAGESQQVSPQRVAALLGQALEIEVGSFEGPDASTCRVDFSGQPWPTPSFAGAANRAVATACDVLERRY